MPESRAPGSRIALVAGASGLVGRELLAALSAAPLYAASIALARRPLTVLPPRCEARLIDYATIEGRDLPHVDDAFCALGTTIRVAGSKPAFRQVDFDFCLSFARAALAAGAQRLLLVSSSGANPASPLFYARTKGEIEAAVSALPFTAVHLFRPSLLAGARGETRPAEKLALTLLMPIAPLLPARYRPVPAALLARAMLAAATGAQSGVAIHESDAIQHAGRLTT